MKTEDEATTVNHSEPTSPTTHSKEDDSKTACSTHHLPALQADVDTTEFWFFPIPPHLRRVPGRPFPFSMLLTSIYAVLSIFITANLYYSQPLLVQMAQTFNVSYEGVARVPVFIQAGFAIGLLLICPLGDTLKRRQLILGLLIATTSFTIALAVTNDLRIFLAFSFLIGLCNASAHILIPLVAEMAPPKKQAFAYSLLLTGLMLGILLARVIAGIIAEFVDWRFVYYTAIGLQSVTLVTLYFILPDHPSKDSTLSVPRTIWTMGKLACTEPLVIQVVLINIGTSMCFTYYWVTLTFLLNGPPYFYNTLQIGLFGLLGMAAIGIGPLSGYIVDKTHPWHATLASTIALAAFQALQAAAGGIHISAVIISCFGLDLFLQLQNVALVTSIFSVSTAAVSRLNAIFMISYYVGSMIGTAVGTSLFVRFGWRAAALFALASFLFQIAVLLVRGPHCERYTWVGYEGGIGRRKTEKKNRDVEEEATRVDSEQLD